MATKICTKCGERKDISEFYVARRTKDGLFCWCKPCTSKEHRKWYQDNIEDRRKACARYRKNNSEQILLRYANRTDEQKERAKLKNREYQRKNKDKVAKWHKKYRETHKNEIRLASKQYRQNNIEKIRQHKQDRIRQDPNFKLNLQIRNMIRYALKAKGHRKESLTKDIVGCDLDFLCDYLFKTWERNYGKPWDGEPYHIDHIIPLAIAHTKEDVLKLNHYTNLQLLTPEDNMAKSDNLPTEIPPNLLPLLKLVLVKTSRINPVAGT